MKNLIYVSPVPWGSFAQRPQKFVNWFHAQYGGQVLWIEPYGTRFPTWSDLKRLKRFSDEKPLQELPSWIRILNARSLPVEPLPGSSWINKRLWKSILLEALDFASVGKCLMVIGKPSVLAISIKKAMPDMFSIYDAMDDFPAFYRGFSRFAMQYREALVMDMVDEIWASSTLLYERALRSHKRTRLIHNGLDMAAMLDVKPVEINKDFKVFGYIGTIGEWFDWDMITALAKAAPNDVVRIIGPLFKNVPKNLPVNIELLPPCDHAQAINQMAQLDVGLIPFLQNKLTASVDPIKYYEYRALGIPIISSIFGEMVHHGDDDGVFLVEDFADIANIIAKVEQKIRPRRLDKEFMDANSWDARFNQTRSEG